MDHEIAALRDAIDTLRTKPFQRKHANLHRLTKVLRGQQGFLYSLSEQHCEIVCKWLGHQHVPEGSPVFQQGEPGDTMYIIIDGYCDSETVAEGSPPDLSLLHRGLSFGEVALVSPRKPRSSTVIAGRNGVHLATLHRGALNHMRFIAETQPAVARAVQSLLAACCSRVLHVPPGDRTPEEVSDLAEFMRHMEAFRRLPEAMVARLAGEVTFMSLPAGWVLFEEDTIGHSMYVVVSGQCHVRARPLPQESRHHHGHRSSSYSGSHSHHHHRASGTGESGTSRSISAAASTHDSDDGSDDETREVVPRERPAAKDGQTVKDSPFWISKYMQQAVAGMSLQDGTSATASQGGAGGQEVTPLAAVAAAKWRQAALQRKGKQEEEDQEEEPRGMEDLLGRAAARALKAAHSNKEHYHYSEANENPADAVMPGGVGAINNNSGSIDPNNHAHHVHHHHEHGHGRQSQDGDGAHLMRKSDGGASAFNEPPEAAEETAPRPAVDDPAKRLLARMASSRPANVSDQLMKEIAGRADVGSVLYQMAKQLVRRGGAPRTLGRRNSKKLSQALHKTILEGGSGGQETIAGHRMLGRAPSMSGTGLPGMPSLASLGPDGLQRLSYSGTGGMSMRGSNSGRPGTGILRSASSAAGGTTPGNDDDDDRFAFSEVTDAYTATTGGGGMSSVYTWGANGANHHSQHRAARRRTTQELPDVSNFLNTELLTSTQLEVRYGPVVRVVSPGESFGELALLQQDAKRTATVVAAPPSEDYGRQLRESSVNGGMIAAGGAGHAGEHVQLICVSRAVYAATVRDVQLQQLSKMTSFLGRLDPFKGLSEQQRISLAVFCRPVTAQAGEVLVTPGQTMDTLYLVQEGEVAMMDSDSLTEALTPSSGRSASDSGGGPRGLRTKSSSAAMHPSPGGGARGGGARPPPLAADPSRKLTSQMSVNNAGGGGGGNSQERFSRFPLPRSVSWNPSYAAGAGGGPGAAATGNDPSRRVMFDTGAAQPGGGGGSGGGAVAPGRLLPYGAMQQGAMLTSLAPGGVFGEGLIIPNTSSSDEGSNAGQLTKSSSRKDRSSSSGRASDTPRVAPRYTCAVVARRPSKLLAINAVDLSRFGPGVVAGLENLNRLRSQFLEQRTASMMAAKAAVQESVAAARALLSEVQAYNAAGLPLSYNTELQGRVEKEHRVAEAAVAAEEEKAAADIKRAAAEAAQSARMMMLPGNTAGLTMTPKSLLPGLGVPMLSKQGKVIYMPGVKGSRAAGPPVSPSHWAAHGAAAPGHHISHRLSAALQDGIPDIPPWAVPLSSVMPPAQAEVPAHIPAVPRYMTDVDDTTPAASMEAPVQPEPVEELSTIAEESSRASTASIAAAPRASVGFATSEPEPPVVALRVLEEEETEPEPMEPERPASVEVQQPLTPAPIQEEDEEPARLVIPRPPAEARESEVARMEAQLAEFNRMRRDLLNKQSFNSSSPSANANGNANAMDGPTASTAMAANTSPSSLFAGSANLQPLGLTAPVAQAGLGLQLELQGTRMNPTGMMRMPSIGRNSNSNAPAPASMEPAAAAATDALPVHSAPLPQLKRTSSTGQQVAPAAPPASPPPSQVHVSRPMAGRQHQHHVAAEQQQQQQQSPAKLPSIRQQLQPATEALPWAHASSAAAAPLSHMEPPATLMRTPERASILDMHQQQHPAEQQYQQGMAEGIMAASSPLALPALMRVRVDSGRVGPAAAACSPEASLGEGNPYVPPEPVAPHSPRMVSHVY